MPRIVDACCTINLYAAGNLLTFLPALGAGWHVAQNVVTETRYVRRPDPADDTKLVREPIDLRPAIDAGVIQVCTPSEGELALFVEIATQVDDGEAMCLAIAQSRGWTLASDDRKARRVAVERGVPLLCTPQIMKQWATVTAASEEDVARLLLSVQTFARFCPNRSLPDADWWEETVKKAAPG